MRSLEEVAHISFVTSSRRANNVRVRDVTTPIAALQQQTKTSGAPLPPAPVAVLMAPGSMTMDRKDEKHAAVTVSAGGSAGVMVLTAQPPPMFYTVKQEVSSTPSAPLFLSEHRLLTAAPDLLR